MKRFNFTFIIFIFTIVLFPISAHGKEVVDLYKVDNDTITIIYDDNTVSELGGYQYDNIKHFLSYYNSTNESLYIDIDNNLYIEKHNSKTKDLLLSNAKRFLTNNHTYTTSSEIFVETYDNKIYKLIRTNFLINIELVEDGCKEVIYIENGTIFYTIDDTGDLYAIGKNTVGSKINNGEYLSERTLVLNNVKQIKNNLILTNNNELYIKSNSLPRPTFVRANVIDFETKSGTLVYIKDVSGDTYRFYIIVSDNVYVRQEEKIDTNDIHKYNDSKTKIYNSSTDSFSYYTYAHLYNEGNLYCNGNLLLKDVIHFGEYYVLTSTGNLYLTGASRDSMYYSHLATTKNCNYQLIDRNVSKLLVNHENIGYSTLIYQKTDKSVWGLGADNVFKVFDQNLGSGYQMPFCALGECKPEIILENKGINTVLVNQKIDFYANVYPTNSEFDVIWKSSDESIATVDSTGYITTYKPGEVTISATVNGVSDSVKLNVIDDKDVFAIDPNENFKLFRNIAKEINFNSYLGDYDNEILITHSDGIYSVSFININTIKIYATKVGKQTITISSKNQKYSKTFEFEVYEDISKIKIPDIERHTATGYQIKPKIEIDGLVEGVDFTVSYGSNVSPTFYGEVTITGIGYYYGSVTKKFYIECKGYLNAVTLPVIEDQYYTGSEITPKVEIEGLIENIDYKVKYDNNVTVGRATIQIEGLAYGGLVKTYFEILPIDIKYSVNDYEIYYDGLEHTIDLNIETEGVKVEYHNGYSYTTTVLKYKEPGTYTIKYRLSRSNYNTVLGESTFTIRELDIIEYNNTPYSNVVYDGNEHTADFIVTTPDVTIKYMDEFGEYTLDNPPKYVDVGYYTIFFQLTKQNHHTITDSQTLIIQPLIIDYYAGGYSGTYDEQEHTFELQVSTPGVIIKYGMTEGHYSLTELPKFIYPGEYIVYIELTKKNYQTVNLSLTVNIDEKGFSYGYGYYVGMYDGEEHGLDINIKTDYPDATILYADEFGSYILTESPKYSEVGQYTIKFMIFAPYYSTAYGEATIKIMGIKEEYSSDYKIINDKYFVISSPKIYSINIKNVFNFLDFNVNYYINSQLDYDQNLKTTDILTIKNLDSGSFWGKEYIISVMGDVNGDGEISPLDYVRIKNHIMGTTTIQEGAHLVAADVNEDGEISPLDYVRVKNYIMNGGE